jgi:putative ABC transport system permease protein
MLGNSIDVGAGSPFSAGMYELLVGAQAALRFSSLDQGAHTKIRDSMWTSTGLFKSGGLWDSEVWSDMSTLQASFNSPSGISVVWVKLESAEIFPAFRSALERDKRLRGTRTESQKSYTSWTVGFVARLARTTALGVGIALGIGVLLAITNALSLSLLARRRSFATLRAVGFSEICLGFALMIEVFILAALAGTIAIVFAWLVIDGHPVGSSTGDHSITFALAVTPEVALSSLGYCLFLGCTAAVWPVCRAVSAALIPALATD